MEKKGKAKKAYITWDANDVSSSSSSDDEEANLCLLASVTSSVDSVRMDGFKLEGGWIV